MNILIVQDYGTPNAGAELGALTLRRALRARGHDARLFTSTARPLPLPVASDYTCHGTFSPARRFLQVANPSAAHRLRVILGSFRPDVVHIRNFLTQLSPLVLRATRDVPTVVQMVNYDYVCPLGTKLLPDGSACRFVPGRACHRNGCLPLAGLARMSVQTRLRTRWHGAVDHVLVMTAWMQARLEREGIHVDEVLWEGVPQVPARPSLDGPPTVGYAGRLVAKKGVDVLLAAMARVVRDLPDARLVVAGDGPERAALEREVDRLGLREHVAMLGHLAPDDLEQALAPVWVQAVPSLWEEPFGMVAAEAMMRGTAVVASDTGGLGELVDDGRTGVKVPVGDAAALAAALLGVLTDAQRAETIGRNAREVAVRQFDEDRYVERIVTIHRELASGRRPVAGATA